MNINDIKINAAKEVERVSKLGWSLKSQREYIKDQSYSSDFPGSAEFYAARAYAEELTKFDAAHPEIVAEIKTADAAKKEVDKKESQEKGWIFLSTAKIVPLTPITKDFLEYHISQAKLRKAEK